MEGFFFFSLVFLFFFFYYKSFFLFFSVIEFTVTFDVILPHSSYAFLRTE